MFLSGGGVGVVLLVHVMGLPGPGTHAPSLFGVAVTVTSLPRVLSVFWLQWLGVDAPLRAYVLLKHVVTQKPCVVG